MLKALIPAMGRGASAAPGGSEDRPYTFDASCSTHIPAMGGAPISTPTTPSGYGAMRTRANRQAIRDSPNAEITELDRWIRAHTLEKFGPNRAVEQTQVFELAYEGIARFQPSQVRNRAALPAILRRRPDKPAAEADSLAALQRASRLIVATLHARPSDALSPRVRAHPIPVVITAFSPKVTPNKALSKRNLRSTGSGLVDRSPCADRSRDDATCARFDEAQRNRTDLQHVDPILLERRQARQYDLGRKRSIGMGSGMRTFRSSRDASLHTRMG